jgi:hypothetical protein
MGEVSVSTKDSVGPGMTAVVRGSSAPRAFVVDRFSPANTFDRYLELYGVTP